MPNLKKFILFENFRGPTRWGIGYRFPVKKSAISRDPVKIFRFSRSRIFLFPIPSSIFFRVRAFFKIVKFEQLSRNCVPGYLRSLPWGCWIQISREKIVYVISDLTRIICPDITRPFHICPVYRIEKLRNYRYLWFISSRYPKF